MLLCALILYLATLDNGFQAEELRGGDLITHQYAQVQARPSNAPGYPLYTMGGWLWFHGWRGLLRLFARPLSNPIPILSSYSLLWAMISLWFFYQIVAVLQQHRLSGTTQSSREPLQSTFGDQTNYFLPWLLSAFYAVTYFFWFYATTTEQYTSAIAQTLAIVYIYIQFHKNADECRSHEGPVANRLWPFAPVVSLPNGSHYVFILAFLSGLTLAHMLTVAFIVPPLIVVILWQRPWLLRSIRTLIGIFLVAALPLVSYLYIYLRGGSHPEWWGQGEWATPQEWFWAFISTAQGRDELARGFESWCGPWAGGFPAGMWHELSLPILLLGIMGISLLGKRMAVLLYGTLLIYLIFCWMYRCGNWFQVILPMYPLILLGLVPLIVRFRELAQDRNAWLSYAPHVLLIAAILWRANASWPQANSRNRIVDNAFDDVALLLNDSLPPGTALYATLDSALALQYLNQIWGIRPDLEIVDHKEARRRIDNGQYVLTTYESTPQLLGEMREEKTIGLWSISPQWVAIQDVDFIDEDSYGDPEVLLNQPIEPDVELVGYSIMPTPDGPFRLDPPKPALDLMLYWRLGTSKIEISRTEITSVEAGHWPDDLSISVRPINNGAFLAMTTIEPDAAPDAIIQQDQQYPMQGLEPISHIPPGQVFGDGYQLSLPSLDSIDGVMVILYRATASGFMNVAEIRLTIP